MEYFFRFSLMWLWEVVADVRMHFMVALFECSRSHGMIAWNLLDWNCIRFNNISTLYQIARKIRWQFLDSVIVNWIESETIFSLNWPLIGDCINIDQSICNVNYLLLENILIASQRTSLQIPSKEFSSWMYKNHHLQLPGKYKNLLLVNNRISTC